MDIALLSIQYSVFSIVVENVIHIDVSRPLNWKKPGEHSFFRKMDYRVCEIFVYLPTAHEGTELYLWKPSIDLVRPLQQTLSWPSFHELRAFRCACASSRRLPMLPPSSQSLPGSPRLATWQLRPTARWNSSAPHTTLEIHRAGRTSGTRKTTHPGACSLALAAIRCIALCKSDVYSHRLVACLQRPLGQIPGCYCLQPCKRCVVMEKRSASHARFKLAVPRQLLLQVSSCERDSIPAAIKCLSLD